MPSTQATFSKLMTLPRSRKTAAMDSFGLPFCIWWLNHSTGAGLGPRAFQITPTLALPSSQFNGFSRSFRLRN